MKNMIIICASLCIVSVAQASVSCNQDVLDAYRRMRNSTGQSDAQRNASTAQSSTPQQPNVPTLYSVHRLMRDHGVSERSARALLAGSMVPVNRYNALGNMTGHELLCWSPSHNRCVKLIETTCNPSNKKSDNTSKRSRR